MNTETKDKEKSCFDVFCDAYSDVARHIGYYDSCSSVYVVAEKFKLLSKREEIETRKITVDWKTTYNIFYFSYFDYVLKKEIQGRFCTGYCGTPMPIDDAEKIIMTMKVGSVFYANGRKFSDGSLGFEKIFEVRK